MYNNQPLSIQPIGQEHLKIAARWERFMAIVQIVILSIFIVLILSLGSMYFDRILSVQNSNIYGNNQAMSNKGIGVVVSIIYAILLGITLIPSIFKLLFANKCIRAINTQDEETLTQAFKQLKTYSIISATLTTLFLLGFIIIVVVMFFGLAAYTHI